MPRTGKHRAASIFLWQAAKATAVGPRTPILQRGAGWHPGRASAIRNARRSNALFYLDGRVVTLALQTD